MMHPDTKERLHRVVILGATPSGISAANKLGELGVPVTLIDMHNDLNARLADEKWRFESGVPFNYAHRPGLLRIMREPGIKTILPAKVNSIEHTLHGFSLSVTKETTFIDPDKCTLCGRCVDNCPVITDDGSKAVKAAGRFSIPGTVRIDKRKEPLCVGTCPLGVNVQGYIALAKAKKYDQALSLIRQNNILPGICGRICTQPCESTCRRNDIDEAVSIRNIKRFIADYGLISENKTDPVINEERQDIKIAIVGSGPAGLAAAAEFAKHGCSVTVYEKETETGGLLRYGIGAHRLPRNILDEEIEYIKKMGVRFITSHTVDVKNALEDLTKENTAVILAIGTWKDRPLGVDGEDLDGIEGCLSYLTQYYRSEPEKRNDKVAVIGDGNAAYDLARLLVRSGSDVTLISWFDKSEITADTEEVKGADEEGVKVKDNTQVVAFKGTGGTFTKLVCQTTMPGEPDENGIRLPVIQEDKETFDLEFDRAFVAIGQIGPLVDSGDDVGLAVTENGFVEADEIMGTNIENVFAAGDGVTGPSSVVYSMAEGRKTAKRILETFGSIITDNDERKRPAFEDFDKIPAEVPVMVRSVMPEKEADTRKENFQEVAEGLSENQVDYETQRCFQCGVCSECLECESLCGAIGAINHRENPSDQIENAGVLIIADPIMAADSFIDGDDVIWAYDPEKSGEDGIYDLITRGYAAASRAVGFLGNTITGQKGQGISFLRPEPALSDEVRTGVFVCRCNDSLGWLDEMTDSVMRLAGTGNVVHSEIVNSACVPDETALIIKTVREKGITRIALASCVCCPLNFICSACTDQRTRLKNTLSNATGISRSMIETCNIRGESLKLISSEPDEAVSKFKGLIERTIKRASRLKPFSQPDRVYNFTTAVLGDSDAELNCAVSLAEAGKDVYLFGSKDIHEDWIVTNPNIIYFKGATALELRGTRGDFQLTANVNGRVREFHAGIVILGENARSEMRYVRQAELPGVKIESKMQTRNLNGIPFYSSGMTSISGLFLSDPPYVSVSGWKKGDAAAIQAMAAMPQGPRQAKGYIVAVNKELCRGCGRCMNVCMYSAVKLNANSVGGFHAVIDDGFCKGCGNCISVCPANAADSPYRNQLFLEKSLEAILL